MQLAQTPATPHHRQYPTPLFTLPAQAPVLMTFDGDCLKLESVALRCALHLVLVDLAAGKDTVVILRELQVRPRLRS